MRQSCGNQSSVPQNEAKHIVFSLANTTRPLATYPVHISTIIWNRRREIGIPVHTISFCTGVLQASKRRFFGAASQVFLQNILLRRHNFGRLELLHIIRRRRIDVKLKLLRSLKSTSFVECSFSVAKSALFVEK